jgi:phospholipid/cholesterol/gamma-HCH transport system substrate-binding protein
VNYTLVGAFVLLLGGALLAGVFWLVSGGAWAKKYDGYLAIENESVAGLNVNAPVKYNGVVVGKVETIQLDPADPQRVRLIFAIERGTPIKEDTVAMLVSQGLTGIAHVELSGGTRGAPPLQRTAGEPYPEIRTKPSLSARLENVLTTALEKMDHLSTNIDSILSDRNQAAFSSALVDLASVAHVLAARKDTIDAGITHAAQAFDNTARATAQLGPVIARVGRGADAVERMGDAATRASASADRTLATVDADVQRFNTQTLPELQRLLGELDGLSTSLRHMSEQAQRNPSEFLLGRSPVPEGPGERSAPQGQP